MQATHATIYKSSLFVINCAKHIYFFFLSKEITKFNCLVKNLVQIEMKYLINLSFV